MKNMTEKQILERLKEIVNIGEMSVSRYVNLKNDTGSTFDRETIEAHFYAIKLGNVIGLLDLLIDDIYSSIERKETDKK